MPSCANLLKFQQQPPFKISLKYYVQFNTQCRGVVVWSSSSWGQNFIGLQVRIQVRTENVSLIFFCADFSTFSYLNCFSNDIRGVQKQCGLSKGRERSWLAAYVIIQFDVMHIYSNDYWMILHYCTFEWIFLSTTSFSILNLVNP